MGLGRRLGREGADCGPWLINKSNNKSPRKDLGFKPGT